MPKKKIKIRRGFTLIEMLVTVALAAVVVLALSVVVADSQRGWNATYNRIYSDVVTGGYVARNTFDAVIRKANGEKFFVDDAGSWLEVYYYADENSIVIDRYARFYQANGELNIDYGGLDPKEVLSTRTVCRNVSGCVFKAAGRSAQMILTLDNGSQTVTVVSSARMHN